MGKEKDVLIWFSATGTTAEKSESVLKLNDAGVKKRVDQGTRQVIAVDGIGTKEHLKKKFQKNLKLM